MMSIGMIGWSDEPSGSFIPAPWPAELSSNREELGRSKDSPDTSIKSPWSKQYDSDGDTIPDLQSVSDSDCSNNEDNEQSYRETTDNLPGMSNSGDLLSDIMLAPPIRIGNSYCKHISNAEEKMALIHRDFRRQCLGDALCNKVEEMLEQLQPYPGDPANVLQFRGRRFEARTVSHNEILVHDKVFNFYDIISRYAMERPCFAVGEWYAQTRSAQTGASLRCQTHYQTCMVVETYSWNARRVLEDGAPYPWDDGFQIPEYHRFEVIPEGPTYHIYDRHIGFKTSIDIRNLKNEFFDLACWFKKQVLKRFRQLDNEKATLPYDPHYYVGDLFAEYDNRQSELDMIKLLASSFERLRLEVKDGQLQVLELNGQQIPAGSYPSIQ